MTKIERLNNALGWVESVIHGMDVGGEQSRQFSEEIKALRMVTVDLRTVRNEISDDSKALRRILDETR